MKFFHKVFFVAIITVVLSFSAGGVYLISSLFREGVNREITLAARENMAIRSAFHAVLSMDSGAELTDERIAALVGDIVEATDKAVQLRVLDSGSNSLYDAGGKWPSGTPSENLGEDQLVTQVIAHGGGYLVQAVSTTMVGGKTLYLESVRDVTGLFAQRQENFALLGRILMALILIDGVILLVSTYWLTRPIQLLTQAAGQIERGDYSRRVQVRGQDEVAELSSQFNRMAEEIQGHVLALEDAARRQEDFAASFAHELKTPLTAMIGYADLLTLKKMTEDDMRMAAGYIASEGRRLENLSLKLLQLIVLKKNPLELEEVSATTLFDRLQAHALPLYQSGPINVHINGEPGVLWIDGDMILALLINLLDNAQKAIETPGEIWVQGGPGEDGSYQITVRDTGRGIPPDQLARVTEAFYRTDKARSRSSGGAGLGLAICNEIVNLHRGKMEIASREGEGTRVTITLPAEGVQP